MLFEGARKIRGVLHRGALGIVMFDPQVKADADPNQGNHHHAEQSGALRESAQPSASGFERFMKPHAITPHTESLPGGLNMKCFLARLSEWGPILRMLHLP